MALSPQMRPSVDRRAFSPRTRRRRRNTWKFALLAITVVAGVGLYLVMNKGDDVATEGAGAGSISRTDAPSMSAANPIDDVLNDVKPAEPVVLRFDGGGAPLLTVVGGQASTSTANRQQTPRAVPPPTASLPNQGQAPAQTMPPQRTTGAAPYDAGVALLRQDKLVEGRAVLSALLTDSRNRLSAQDAQTVREMLTQVNKDLVFSSRIVPGDPLVTQYTIVQGDNLSAIAPKHSTSYEFIARVNGINPNRIRAGQKIKIVKGPFHAVVSKKAYRMDLYLPDPAGKLIYIRSYPVGLGENDSTPVGSWVLAKNGKVKEPSWTDPRTGKFYAKDSPDNPLGGYWMRLEGTDDNTRGKEGYGIHGTDEQESIGQQESLGCIRMRDGDIQELFEMLIDGKSTVYVAE